MHNPTPDTPESATTSNPAPATAPDHQELLNSLISGSLGPLARLQESINHTVDQVGRWIANPANRQQLTNLITVLDAQTQLVVSQQRLVAVARLVDVAANAPGYETTRRACADLLRIRLIDPYLEDRRPTPPPDMTPPANADEIRAVLEELGAEDYQHSSVRSAPPSDLEPFAQHALDDALHEMEQAEREAPPSAQSSMSNGARHRADGAPDSGSGAQPTAQSGIKRDEGPNRAAARNQVKPPAHGRARHRTYL